MIKAENYPIATGVLEPSGKIEKLVVLKKYRNFGYEILVLKKKISEDKIKKMLKVFINTKVTKAEYIKKEGFINDNKVVIKSSENDQQFVKEIYD